MNKSINIPVRLNKATVIQIEATSTDTEQEISSLDEIPFNEITKILKGIGKSFGDVFNSLGADKSSIKLGLEISLESGALTALIVKGTGKANFEVNLEWSKPTA